MKNYNDAANEFIESLTDVQLKRVAKTGARVYAYASDAELELVDFHLSAGDPTSNSEHPLAEQVLARDYRFIAHVEYECAQSHDDPTNDPDQLRESIAGAIDQDLRSKLDAAIQMQD